MPGHWTLQHTCNIRIHLGTWKIWVVALLMPTSFSLIILVHYNIVFVNSFYQSPRRKLWQTSFFEKRCRFINVPKWFIFQSQQRETISAQVTKVCLCFSTYNLKFFCRNYFPTSRICISKPVFAYKWLFLSKSLPIFLTGQILQKVHLRLPPIPQQSVSLTSLWTL